MYKVVVENECNCFIKSGLESEQSFSSEFEAKMEAEDMLESMNKNFCKKHKFRLEKSYDGKSFKIVIY